MPQQEWWEKIVVEAPDNSVESQVALELTTRVLKKFTPFIIAEANRRRDAEWREKLEELKGDLFNANGIRQARWKLYHFTGVEMPPNKIFDAVLDEAKKLFL